MGNAERWARVAELFDAAVAMRPAERERFVRASHAADDVQQDVLSLLASHDDAGEFLEPSAAGSGGGTARPAAVALAGDDHLGPYRIIKILGQGGMGVVYQAEDTLLHRVVALKLLSPAVAGDEQQSVRLLREARAAAALKHPGIAMVYTAEFIDRQLVIVSEYLDGETLRAELERGPLSPARAIDTAIDIARAMVAAHGRGIVHRDLKPENLVRTTDGTLKVVDFGLAQFDEAARDLVSITRLTQAGMVAGTPPYMAPEQLLGHTIDFRADHFALGVVLYEMWTGRHPFGGQSLPSMIARILASDPDPLPGNDELPDRVWRVIERCLQKDPAARFDSTAMLLGELEALRAAPFAAPAAPPSLAPGSHARVPPPLAPTSDAIQLPERESAFWWWQFHQIAAAAVYWAMVWPVWHVHRGIGRGGLFFFFATLAAVVVSANLRIHLWFSSRVYPDQLAAQRAEVGRWIRTADCAFVALLVAGGLLLPEDQAAWAAVLLSVGIGTTVAFLIIEPSTARAAFTSGR